MCLVELIVVKKKKEKTHPDRLGALRASRTGPVDSTPTACLTRFSMIMGTSLLPITDAAIITAREAPSGVITRRMTILMRDSSLPSVSFSSAVTLLGDLRGHWLHRVFYFRGVNVKKARRPLKAGGAASPEPMLQDRSQPCLSRLMCHLCVLTAHSWLPMRARRGDAESSVSEDSLQFLECL